MTRPATSAWSDEAILLGYITPESIRAAQAACDNDPDLLATLAAEVFWAMSDRRVEDWNLCAFVMADVLGPFPDPFRPWRTK